MVSSRGFFHLEDAISGDILQSLNDAGGPADLDGIGLRMRAEAEVHGAVARRSVAHAGGLVVVLAAAAGGELDASTDTVTIALRALESNIEPVAGRSGAVHPDLGRARERCRDDIDAAVAIEISEREAAVAGGRADAEAGFVGERDPFAVPAGIVENGVRLIDILAGLRERSDMASADEDVFPPVVIQIVETRAEAGHAQSKSAEAGGRRHFVELAFTSVLKERKSLLGQSDEKDIGKAVVVVIAKIESHAGDELAIFGKSNASGKSHFFELTT